MTKLMKIDADGRAWVERSLSEGFALPGVDRSSSTLGPGIVRVIVPGDFDDERFDLDAGGVIRNDLASAALAPCIDQLVAERATCLVIEDDVARKSDPALDEMRIPSAFLGQRVIHWVDMEPGFGRKAVAAIREGAFGYPLNAFISERTAAELGLAAGAPVPDEFSARLADSLVAVVVSAFDGESFVVWSRA